MSVITSMLLDGLDEGFDKKSWHGPNLRGAIRGVTAVQAAWRPVGDRHNIWELTLHAAYWKYTVRRKIFREKRGSFVLAGSNFFERPEGDGSAATQAAATETEWKRDIAILEAEHRSCAIPLRNYQRARLLRRSRRRGSPTSMNTSAFTPGKLAFANSRNCSSIMERACSGSYRSVIGSELQAGASAP